MEYVDRSRFLRVPLAFMNEDHDEEARLLEDLGSALEEVREGEGDVERVLERLSLLAVHTREHFLREETAMRVGEFPAYALHKAEHDRVLAEMDAEVHRFRATRDGARLARYLFDVIPAWFEQHIASLDLAMARFLVEHGAGAAAP